MSSLPGPVPTECPLCGQPNLCAMEIERATGVTQAACWCTRVAVSSVILDRIAPEARGMACICQACISAGNDAALTTPHP